MNDVLDEIDRAILTCLTQDARVSLKVLSARVGLTSPSIAERVKRLEERGVIQGYGARVNLAALGYSLQALVRVRPLPGLLQKVDKYIQAMPECIESDKVTGEDCFVMRLVVRDIAQLDTLLDRHELVRLRAELARILKGADTQTLPHDSVFAKLADASKLFQVVVLKTESTLAYSSVFIELDCAYWSPAKEKALREKLSR